MAERKTNLATFHGKQMYFQIAEKGHYRIGPKGPFAEARSRTSPSSDNIYQGTGKA